MADHVILKVYAMYNFSWHVPRYLGTVTTVGIQGQETLSVFNFYIYNTSPAVFAYLIFKETFMP